MTCEIIQIQTTVNSEEEAQKLIHRLFDEKLVVCAQYFPIKSFYRWKGELEQAEEVMIFFKTQKAYFERIQELFKKYHPYELPELISICVEKISEDYYKWILTNT